MSVAHIRENEVSGCGHQSQISPLQASVFKISLVCILIEIHQKPTFGSVFRDFGITTGFLQQPKYFSGNLRVFLHPCGLPSNLTSPHLSNWAALLLYRLCRNHQVCPNKKKLMVHSNVLRTKTDFLDKTAQFSKFFLGKLHILWQCI